MHDICADEFRWTLDIKLYALVPEFPAWLLVKGDTGFDNMAKVRREGSLTPKSHGPW